jgi:hypothetical protein
VSDNEVIALVCYVTNAFPELPRIGKTLDRVVRHMVKNLPLEEMEPLVESILPDVQHLLHTRHDLMPLSTFARFDQEVHHMELLEVLPGQGRAPRPRSIEVDLVSSRKRLRLSS